MYCRSLLEEEISYNIYQKTEKKQILKQQQYYLSLIHISEPTRP